jgi:hypothetical protein
MIAQGSSVKVNKFDMASAAVKAQFSTTFLADLLLSELKARVAKEGFAVAENAAIVIDGKFTMIDQGSRFLRYLFGFFGPGSTKCEVEGSIKDGGQELTSFCFMRKGRGGFGGGNSELLLRVSMRPLAKKIAKLLRKI